MLQSYEVVRTPEGRPRPERTSEPWPLRHESDVGHQIDGSHLPSAIAWLEQTLGLSEDVG